MHRALHIILSISPIILFFLAGLLLRKLRFFQPGTVQDIKKLVVSCSLPALLYGAFSSLELRRGMLLIVAAVFITCILMVLIGRVIARLLRIKSPYFALLFGGFETGMIGYAIFISVYGAAQVDKLALIDLGQVLFVFSVLVALLLKLRGERDSIPALFKHFISSPVILAIFAGLATALVKSIFQLQGNAATETLGNTLKMVGGITIPLICLVIGYELHLSIKSVKLPLLTIGLRSLFLLGFAILLNRFILQQALQLNVLYKKALFTMFLLPPPFVIPLFIDEADRENIEFATNTLSVGTLISALLFVIVSSLI